MKTLGNIIWFLVIGLWSFLYTAFGGIVLCVTIIGIPFGLQLFKIAGFYLWPFGRTIKSNFGKHPIMNIIWILLAGWESAIGFVAAGLLCCITIIGIPFGLQCFKLAQLSFLPFGAEIE